MKLLLFSDLHCDAFAAAQLCERAGDFDFLIGAGDFANARRGLDITLPFFLQIETPCIFVPGNNESRDELHAACESSAHLHVLHGETLELHGTTFFGIGGGIPPTPFGNWSFDLTEQDAAEMLKNCPRDAILVSHSPPYGTLDVASSGQHLGSHAVAKCLREKEPKLLVCGHIHHSGGQQTRAFQTLVVNAGREGIALEL